MPYISDLFLPFVLLCLAVVGVLGGHYLYIKHQVKILITASTPKHSKSSYSKSSKRPVDPTFPDIDSRLPPIDVLTAQNKPIALQEEHWPAYEQVPSLLGAAGLEHQAYAKRSSQEFFQSQTADETPAHLPSHQDLTPLTSLDDPEQTPQYQSTKLSDEPQEPNSSNTSGIRTPPTETVLNLAPHQDSQELYARPLHPVLQHIVRLRADAMPSRDDLQQILKKIPWSGQFNVQSYYDLNHNSIEFGIYLVNRKAIATVKDLIAFDGWVRAVAQILHLKAPPELLPEPCQVQIDTAFALLQDLDAVVNLRVQVPNSQLDLFEQSLKAARFTPAQEHWVFESSLGKDQHGIWLERLWRNDLDANATLNSATSAVFQMAIDIPNLGLLEARKAYMRIRAVARASASILQTDQGLHLSEGMLDRFAREINYHQTQLIHAGIEPASDAAHTLFKPRIVLQKDLHS